jgi:hypothetical protein
LTQRRHRSAEVALWAVPLLAAAVTGCGGSSSAYCVDRNNSIVQNRYCDTYNNPNYFWYYGGTGGAHVGQRLHGGSAVVSTNVSENVKRGGFGSSSKSGGVGRSVSVTVHSSGG